MAPDGGGPSVFVHINSFSNRHRRPVGNESVTYELTSDAQGRRQGVNVAFVGDRSSSPRRTAMPGPGAGALGVAFVFLAFVAGAVAAGNLPALVLYLYLAGSCVAYLAYVFDKAAARKGLWRTQESTLHFFSLIGGWPGAMLAQRTLRHKTQKRSFQVVYWITVVVNCAALGWLFTSTGVRFAEAIIGAL